MKKTLIALLLCFCLVFSGCGDSNTFDSSSFSASAVSAVIASSEVFSDRDYETEYSTDDCTLIVLADSSTAISGDGAVCDGDIITISSEGTYIISGSLSDGQIVVDCSDDKVQIVLDGVDISNSYTAGIYVAEADKVFITLASGSENTISVTIGAEDTSSDESHVDAAIFSRGDLTINGSGTLSILSTNGNGITSKDDLKITGGTFEIVCTKNGLEANDTLAIADGIFNIVTNGGSGGIYNDYYDDMFSQSSIMGGMTSGIIGGMTGGNTGGMSRMSDTSTGDSITLLAMGGMTGGTMGGSSIDLPYSPDSPDMDAVADWFLGIGNTTYDTWDLDSSSDYSSKAIKCDDVIYIEGGVFTIDSYDDAIHSDIDLVISGGVFDIATGDDAIHAEIEAVISGGTINISTCYEGIEGMRVTIAGGDIYINAQDDGINASKSDKVTDIGDITITISGGTLVIDSTNEGDGVDSNGSIYMYGGYVLISSTTTTTDTSLDFEDEAVITGGTFLATGANGVTTENFTDAEQGSIFVALSTVQTGTVTLSDSSGNIIASWNPTKEYQTVHISSSEIEKGETYTLTCGTLTQTITMTDLIYGTGNHSSNSGGMMSGNTGGMTGRR